MQEIQVCGSLRRFLFLGILIQPLVLFSQTDSLKDKSLPEVVIQENRIQVPLSRVSQNIQVISKQEMLRTPARSIQEVLTFAGGLDVRQRGPGGVQADIGIRGGTFEQTLLLLNGIKLTDPQTAHHLMNIPVPLAAINRIDVLKGPASRIYGQNAYSGAINLVTKIPDSLRVEAQVYAGDFNTQGTSLFAALPAGILKQSIAFSADNSAGHQRGSDFSVLNAFYEASIAIKKHHVLRLLTGYTARDFGAFGYYTDTNRFKNPWEAGKTFLSAISHEFSVRGFSINTRAYWRQNKDEFRLKKMIPSFYTNLHTTDVLAIEVNGTIDWALGKTGVGLEGRIERINSSNLGNRERELSGAFLEHRISLLKKADVRAGVYSNYYDGYGWKHFPGAEMGYQLTARSRLYANWGKSFRIPSYTELYYQDPNNSSNPSLGPEEAVSYELGYRYKRAGVQSSICLFSRRSENMIDYYKDKSVNDGKWTPRNISRVDLNGFEFNVQQELDFGSKYLRVSLLGLQYCYLDATAPSDTNSRYALTAVRHQAIGHLGLTLFDKFNLSLKGRYISRITFDPYWLMDARLNYYPCNLWSCFLEITNLTNTDYIEAGYVRMPGRWMKAGFSITL